MSIGWIIFILTVIGWLIGMYGMFKKAGIAEWKALIPFYNTWCIIEKIKLNKIWFFLQFIPIVGQFITIWITIKFVEHFGRFSVLHHTATVFVPFIYFPYLGFSSNEKYAGDVVVKNYKKSVTREWIDAAVFAIVAATLIRTFIFEAYTIPSPSMEKTLLVNDYLFVSKFSYGPRIPNTPIAMPFVHNTMPLVNMKSYVEWIHIPYTRWFASPVKRNDVVVFNFPANDTLINIEDIFGSKKTYYQEVRDTGRENVWDQYGDYIITRPVDKRENFIKRCVAVAGDSLQVKNGIVYINGQKQDVFPQSEKFYKITFPTNVNISLDRQENETDEAYYYRWLQHLGDMLRPYGIDTRTEQGDITPIEGAANSFLVNITNEERANLHLPAGYSISDYIMPVAADLYPYYSKDRQWSADNYGPIWIPKKGFTIQLTPDNIIRYQRCIQVYEGNKFEQREGKIYINDTATDSYTFKMDYYWMMGDNRHNSLDSRYWGYVPEDHVVGKASLIWFSWEDGPRWKRIFQWIK
jgi:signal peptidase I